MKALSHYFPRTRIIMQYSIFPVLFIDIALGETFYKKVVIKTAYTELNASYKRNWKMLFRILSSQHNSNGIKVYNPLTIDVHNRQSLIHHLTQLR